MGYAKGLYMQVSSKNIKADTGRVITPLKFNMEPKNWWLVDVSPFPFGGEYFSGNITTLLKQHLGKYKVDPYQL